MTQRLAQRGVISFPAALENFVIAVHRLSTALGESKGLAQSGIGISEWAILKVLGDQKEYQQHVLRKSGVSRQRIRKLLQELETKRIVTISQSDGDDRRQRIIAATPRALECRRNALAGLAELISQLDSRGRGTHDLARLAKRLQSFASLSERISKALRRDAKRPDDDWPETKTLSR